ncbi:zinc finger protein 70-like isoform X44 [Tribolium madens]|uniref:zinc finger protein 70-like isoform X44 n=1 Tax=Tribolium madens TaxID=41895 RepID=UPI001CF734BD|nr:zinc finger protein 70-like isoform X44 [Tribolium madens]
MGSIENISELCRLCLVKDQVNVPIFEENASKEQTFVKINSCLPVKVSRDDSLPKKICDGCSCKLDMLYNFRNTSVDSEKQLLKWLNQADLSCSQSAAKDPLASTKPEIMIKQETFEPTDSRGDDNSDMGMDTHSYLMQQQKLPYPQEFEFGGPSESNVGLMTDEPAPKRAKRAAALNKAPIETDDDDLDAAMQITKAEEEDSEEIDQPDYVEAPSTSADDQPGPSGVGKASVEAPFKQSLKDVRLRKGHSTSEFCNICDKTFETTDSFKRHLHTTHAVPARIFTCLSCGKQFRKKQLLKYHEARHIKDFKVKCDQCDRGFYTMLEFKNHYAARHRGLSHVCKHCGKSFLDKNCFRRHVLTHDVNYVKQEYKCTQCDKVYTTRGGLNVHKKMHENLTYMCDICGKSVTSRTSLKHHMMLHTGEKPFVCEFCGKNFNKKMLLKTHERIHTKEKPYKCSLCAKSFSQRSTLTIHTRIHTGERPFVCGICQRDFVTKTLLKAHMKVHGTDLVDT